MPLMLCLLSVPVLAQDKYDKANAWCVGVVEEKRISACAQKACKKALACDNVCIEKYADDMTGGAYESCRAKCWDKSMEGCRLPSK